MILDTVRAMMRYKDANNRVLRCNRAAARYAGRPVSKIEASLVSDFMPRRARAYHLNDLAVIASGAAKIGELEEVKLRGGARCWMQRDTLRTETRTECIVGVVIIAVDVNAQARRGPRGRQGAGGARVRGERLTRVPHARRRDQGLHADAPRGRLAR